MSLRTAHWHASERLDAPSLPRRAFRWLAQARLKWITSTIPKPGAASRAFSEACKATPGPHRIRVTVRLLDEEGDAECQVDEARVGDVDDEHDAAAWPDEGDNVAAVAEKITGLALVAHEEVEHGVASSTR